MSYSSREQVWREISNYIENNIDPQLRSRMKQHFKRCAQCTAILEGTTNVIRLVGDERSFSLPPGFSERLRSKIDSEMRPSPMLPGNSGGRIENIPAGKMSVFQE